MKSTNFLKSAMLMSLFAITSCANVEHKSYNEGINIIPTPLQMVESEEGSFTVTSRTAVGVCCAELVGVANHFAEQISLATGYKISVVEDSAPIEISIDSTLDTKAEGYKLTVTPSKVSVVGKDVAGAFYGMQSFMQLLPAEIMSKDVVKNISWSAPSVDIVDEPRFGYRGVMIDVGRHFMSIEDLKRELDIFAMYKINRFHWHLTEDQGWRIEIKKYPRLTQIGSKRVNGDGSTHSGYYTQDEIRDLVAYAAARQITVIPEFELPGHERAAIAAYPELACKPSIGEPRSVWGVEAIILCPAKEFTMRFIEDVIDEMVELFPGEYFHIGGDECPKVNWKECPRCQALIRREGLQAADGHTAEQRLQSYVIHQVEQMLIARGKKMVGWDEILEGGVSESATVMSWRGEVGGIAAAMADRDVIMTPDRMVYLDYTQGDSCIEPVSMGTNLLTLETVYNYDPTPKLLVENGKSDRIVGVQANMWTEYCPNVKRTEYSLFPRTFALAEIAWSSVENKDFECFADRVDNACVRLDMLGVNYHIPLPEQPNGSSNYVAFTDSVDVEFTTTRPITMLYTLDGSDPTLDSSVYSEPFNFTEDATIKIRSVLPSGVMSMIREVKVVKQNLSPAVELDGLKSGLKVGTISGYYLNSEALAKATELPVMSTVKSTNDIVLKIDIEKTRYASSVQSARTAEGYVDIPTDGVYYFRTNFNELWIDGELVVDNNDEVKINSRNVNSKALEGGLHSIKIVWLGSIVGGWPANWNSGRVFIREANEPTFVAIQPSQLYYSL